MRYWIWWNDLIQGPFEPDELTSLKSFSEELLVCMEDRQEWIPASRVADLSAAIEQLRARQAAPRMPPPPPPKRPPSVTPLQGEFFADPPGQETLLESDDSPKGPFAYRPVSSDSDLPPWAHLRGQATMPFHFVQLPTSPTSVIEIPQPRQIPHPIPQVRPSRITMAPPPARSEALGRSLAGGGVAPQPVIRESPVPKIEDEAPIPLRVLDTASSTLEEPYSDKQQPQWFIWIVGVVITLGVLGSLGYWLVDRATTRSAITEANRIEPGKPLIIPQARLASVGAAPVPPVPVSSPIPAKVEQYVASKSEKAAAAAARRKSVTGAPLDAVLGEVAVSGQNEQPLHPKGVGVPGVSAAAGQTSSSLGSAEVRPEATREAQTDASDQYGQFLRPQGVGASQMASAAVMGAVLGAESGIGTAAGSAFVRSSLSSAASHASSRWGSAQAASEAQTAFNAQRTIPISSKQSFAGEIAAGGQDGPSLNVNGVGTSQTASAAAVMGATAGAEPGVGAAAQSTSAQLAPAAQTAPEAQTANKISSKQGSPRHVAANSHHKQSIHPKRVGTSQTGSAAGTTSAAPRATPSATPDGMSGTDTAASGSASAPSAAAVASAIPHAMPGIGAVSGSASSALPSTRNQASLGRGLQSATPDAPAPKMDPWKGKQSEAIALVQNKTLPKSKITIGNQARAILQEMHEKELIHAAETGERLYLPDKIAWAALQEEGSLYRVYLNFLSWQATGERVQSRSYQFFVDLKKKEVRTEDASAQQDLLTQPAELTFKHNPMATDIESILGGVDTFNKHQVQLIIVKKNSRNREERKKIEAALAAAQGKIIRAAVYFRKTYTEKALENVAKAYAFSELLKG